MRPREGSNHSSDIETSVQILRIPSCSVSLHPQVLMGVEKQETKKVIQWHILSMVNLQEHNVSAGVWCQEAGGRRDLLQNKCSPSRSKSDTISLRLLSLPGPHTLRLEDFFPVSPLNRISSRWSSQNIQLWDTKSTGQLLPVTRDLLWFSSLPSPQIMTLFGSGLFVK